MTPQALTAKQQYDKDGCYVVKGGLERAYIDNFLSEINLLLIKQLERAHLTFAKGMHINDIYQNLTTLFHFDQKIYLATLRIFSKLKTLFDMMFSKEIADTCKNFGIQMPLFHTAPVLHIMTNKLLFDGGYNGIGIHQDWTSLQTSLNTITVWVPFVDIDENLFPLEFIPGSHLLGLCKGQPSTHTYEVDEAVWKDKKFTPIKVEVGDIVLMSNFTLHRTGKSDTNGLRLAASWRYEDALEKTFMERDFPFAQSRVFKRDLFIENFPSPKQIKEIY